MSDRRINRIADAALAAQADRARQWDSSWGDFIETAWWRGKLSDDRVERYCRTAFAEALSIEARRRVRVGGNLPVRMDIRNARGGSLMTVTSNVPVIGPLDPDY